MPLELCIHHLIYLNFNEAWTKSRDLDGLRGFLGAKMAAIYTHTFSPGLVLAFLE